tara:strand:- start:1911 stop:2672 length:762 start_codon:yes stop_codon:yes gene_type:complete
MVLKVLRCILLISLSSTFLQGQIVNIEQFRSSTDTSNWSFTEQFNFGLLQNTQRLISFNNSSGLQFQQKKFRSIFLTNFSFSSTNNNDIERSGFLHLRFENSICKYWSFEYFGQAQMDVPLKINQRYLLGAGLRASLHKRKKLSFYTGHLLMAEYDEEIETGLQHQDLRLSSYLNLNWHPSPDFTCLLITYYQPRLDRFADYRISFQGQLSFKIWKSLSFTFNAQYAFDAFPVALPNIPQQTYKLSNGINFKL